MSVSPYRFGIYNKPFRDAAERHLYFLRSRNICDRSVGPELAPLIILHYLCRCE